MASLPLNLGKFMAKRKQWKSQQKSEIVLQALQGRPVSEICLEYGIGNSLFYKWKEQFLRVLLPIKQAKTKRLF